MIKTKDLEEFILEQPKVWNTQEMEYNMEIVARLRAFDKLKESIDKYCHDLSNEVDK